LPRLFSITDSDVREAISQSIDTLVEAIREVLETTPPEILSDIMRSGIILTGGGALLKGLDTLLTQETLIVAHVLITLITIGKYKDLAVLSRVHGGGRLRLLKTLPR
jgi:actin-like ATPase involved in cell morphogenesis